MHLILRRAVTMVLSVIAAAASAQEKPADPVKVDPGDPAQLGAWITYYYEHPDPEHVPEAYRGLMAMPEEKIGRATEQNAAFFAEIFRKNPGRVSGWCKELADVPANRCKTLWLALWMADRDETRAILQARAEKAPENEREWIQSRLDRTPTDLLEGPPRSPQWLDMLWMSFFASGDERYVIELVGVVDIPDHEELEKLDDGKVDGAPLLIHGAANWSVRANAFQHDRVLRICEAQEPKQPERIAKELREIIKKVQDRREKERSPDPALRSGPEPEPRGTTEKPGR
jgi:hypothetical protein